MYIIETERLKLREFTTEDAENSYLLNSDPEVIKYTGDPPFESVEAARDFLSKYDHYQKYGMGRWAVISKETDEFLGWCGLKFHPEENVHDIGYRFFKKHWNKGYASEAAKACLDYGFTKFNMPFIVGHAMHGNKASIRVFEKIGMTYLKDDLCQGNDSVVYRVEKG